MTKNLAEIEFWTGARNKIPLCCILFYECVWYPSIKKLIANYSVTMTKLTNNQGIILCPECIVKSIADNKKKNEQKIKIKQIV